MVSAGLEEERARHVSNHDLRHAALTRCASHTSNLAGIAYLAGHRQVTTAARYVHGQKAEAAEVLRAVVNGEPEWGTDGARAHNDEGPAEARPVEVTGIIQLRKRGLEPPHPCGHRNLNAPGDARRYWDPSFSVRSIASNRVVPRPSPAAAAQPDE